MGSWYALSDNLTQQQNPKQSLQHAPRRASHHMRNGARHLDAQQPRQAEQEPKEASDQRAREERAAFQGQCRRRGV